MSVSMGGRSCNRTSFNLIVTTTGLYMSFFLEKQKTSAIILFLDSISNMRSVGLVCI
jgi:hypothetical protein